MSRTPLIALIATTLAGVGVAVWLNADEPRKPWPKPTPPPPPSPIYTPSEERVPTADEIAESARSHDAQIELAIERALVARDPQQRETAFTFLLPQLLQAAPKRVVDMVARQEP